MIIQNEAKKSIDLKSLPIPIPIPIAIGIGIGIGIQPAWLTTCGKLYKNKNLPERQDDNIKNSCTRLLYHIQIE